MDRDLFMSHLMSATQQCLERARIFIVEHLPEECRYRIFPNQSYDGNPLVGDEQVFPEDSLPEGQFQGPMEAETVVSYLWREGKVPEWIDMVVSSADGEYTTLSLRCCGRFTGTYEYLYHHPDTINYLRILGGEVPPFSPKGVYFPPGWSAPLPKDWRKNPPDWPVWVERFGRFHLTGQ